MAEVATEGKRPKGGKSSVHKFDTQADKILDIVINSLYTDKGVAIRELVSNASDALERLRYESVINPALAVGEDEALQIVIRIDPANSTITITDNGVGMSKDDLIENLGTIARSGTESFVHGLKAVKEGQPDLIGHFGVGFYSAFMIADRVEVKSSKLGRDEAWCWSSNGKGEFSIAKLDEEVPRGTAVIMHVRESEKAFLDKFKIENIVSTYADHIDFPINYVNEKGEYEKLNEGSSPWRKNAKSITAEQHHAFFQAVAHVGGEPWLIMHNHNEGSIEYINLLYIPSVKPFDLFHPDRKCSVKLYINKVFITDSNVELVPAYMRFLKGVIDSADLPLNISRETLQNNAVIAKIKHSIANRTIKELRKKAKEDPESYNEVFWKHFGAVLKEGLCEFMPANEREKLFGACRFYSNKHKTLISLEDYLQGMKEEQEYIYYLASNSVEAAAASPQIEGFENRDVDVLFLVDPVDNFWTNVNSDYKGKKFMSVTRAESGLEKLDKQSSESDEEQVEVQQDADKVNVVSEYIKKILGDKISAVRASSKLVNSPACLAVQEGAMDIRMERFMLEQQQIKSKSSKILEINMSHPVVAKLADNLETDCGRDIVTVLFYQACVLEGEELDDPTLFRDSVNRLISG